MREQIVQDIDNTLLYLNEEMRRILEFRKEAGMLICASDAEHLEAYAAAVQALAEYRGKICVA